MQRVALKDQQYHMSTEGAKERGPRTECAMPHCKHITIIATHEHSAHRVRCPRIAAHLPAQARSARGSSARLGRPIRHHSTDPLGTGLSQSGRAVANGGGAAKCRPAMTHPTSITGKSGRAAWLRASGRARQGLARPRVALVSKPPPQMASPRLRRRFLRLSMGPAHAPKKASAVAT